MRDQELFARSLVLAVLFFKEFKEEKERGHTGAIRLLRPRHFPKVSGNQFRTYMLDEIFSDSNRSLIDAAITLATQHPSLGLAPPYAIAEIHGYLVELSGQYEWSRRSDVCLLTESCKLERSFIRAVRFIQWKHQEDSASDSRLDYFVFNQYLKVGYSNAGQDRIEHVVPCAYIRDKVRDCLTDGTPVEGIARFVRKHYAVVKISREEQIRLDDELNLKTKMPDGWDWETGCLFERLHAAKIKFNPPESLPPRANLCAQCKRALS
jgi:hypothetical protein